MSPPQVYEPTVGGPSFAPSVGASFGPQDEMSSATEVTFISGFTLVCTWLAFTLRVYG